MNNSGLMLTLLAVVCLVAHEVAMGMDFSGFPLRKRSQAVQKRFDGQAYPEARKRSVVCDLEPTDPDCLNGSFESLVGRM